MLGSYNRQKYLLDNQALMDQDYNPWQFEIESTPVFRTIQSGYAELMGLFPPKVQSASDNLKRV